MSHIVTGNQYTHRIDILQIPDICYEICRWIDLVSIINLYRAIKQPIPLIYAEKIICVINKTIQCYKCETYCGINEKIYNCNKCEKIFCYSCANAYLTGCASCWTLSNNSWKNLFYCKLHITTINCHICNAKITLCDTHIKKFMCCICHNYVCSSHDNERFSDNRCISCEPL